MLFVTVFLTAVDPLCKNSLKTGSLLGYLDGILSNHNAGCCSINFSFLSQTRREKMCFPSKDYMLVVLFCETAVVSMPHLANFSPCNTQVFHLRQDPLEAILVIFGRGALIFSKLLEKNEK